MKVKHLLLGIAVVALMAACGKKEETVSTTVTPMDEVVEPEPEQQPVEQITTKTESTKPAAKTEVKSEPAKPTVNPCDAKVAAFEAYYRNLKASSEDLTTGEKLVNYSNQLKDADNQLANVKECQQDPAYKDNIAAYWLKIMALKNSAKKK
ncbi:MAG: hypothetical protein LBR17_00990 [Bacteroidales bacterium]|jgi:hypothetical protein|nr:hypothetical protein [Bacteroidales bacterium]